MTVLVSLTVAVFFLTYFSIKESRSDSLKLLVIQGEAFIESLSSAAKNAISSEEFYNRLAHKRYNEISIELEQRELDKITNDDLYRLCLLHNLFSVHIFDVDSTLKASSFARGSQLKLPDFVIAEMQYLLSNPEENYLLLLDDDSQSGEARHYYIKMSNKMDRVIVIVADAHYFLDALEQTQIGYLARQMASDRSIVFIIYQAKDGIVFSSLDIDGILSIESDTFLSEALESEKIMHRITTMDDIELLEIVRPFSTSDYPFGLLRIGLSLDAYNSISRRFDIQMIIFSGGLLLLFIVSVVYLSSRKKRKKISAQYDKYKSISDKIFNEMKTGVAAVDREGNIIVVNSAFEDIFHTDRLSGEKWDETISELIPSFPSLQKAKTRLIEEEILYRKNNESKVLLVVLSSLASQSDKHDGFVVVINDITMLRELEQKTARKERLSEMGDLAAGVAHEIRNPLNTISIASQRLAVEFTPNENEKEFREFTNQIRNETKRLNDIITRFLALARGESKKNQRIDLNQLISQFILLIKAEADDLNINIKTELSEGVYITAEQDKIKQVLSNLFNNAKEAINNKPGEIKISTQNKDNVSILIFEDNGPGIPSEIQEKVFTPYYTTKEAGTGLGLPTVYRIITDFGGEIKVEKSSIGGAMFTVRFL